MLMLGVLTGTRRGELCALRWSDVDVERGELDVSKSVVVSVGGLAEKSTKTDRFRRVALDEVGVLLLGTHRENVVRWAQAADATVLTDAYVLSPSFDGSRPVRPEEDVPVLVELRWRSGGCQATS